MKPQIPLFPLTIRAKMRTGITKPDTCICRSKKSGSYGKLLVLGMNYDRLTLTSENAHELLGAFAGQVKLSIS